MEQRTILTVDVGTSSTKTAVWDTQGRLLAEASAAYSLHRPSPLVAEIDADCLVAGGLPVPSKVIAESGVHPDDIAGIGIDGVGWTLIPVDEAANPLAPAMIWLDRRAEEETAWLKGLPEAERLVNLSPIPLTKRTSRRNWSGCKQNQPEIFDAAP